MEHLDSDQQKAVASLTNAVVTAGAGSGKTTVLAARFLYLVRESDVPIEGILALTFTNKAAVEMYTRIYQELRAAADEKLKTALLNFHKAHIATLDSFSARIARADAVRFGLAEDFTIAEDDLESLIERAALELYLENAERPSLQSLARRHGLSGLCRDVLGRIARECFTLAEDTDFPAWLDRQYAGLDALLPDVLSAWETACTALLEEDFRKYKTVIDNRAVLEQALSLRGLCAAGRWAEVRALLDGLSLAKPGGRATPPGERMKGLIDQARSAADRLGRLGGAYAERELRGDFHAFLNDFQALVNGTKRAAGCVGFADVARMAVVALRENRPLREFFKNQFRYIMIDEFQDNNRLQKELLYLLAEKRSLALDRVPGADELEPNKLFFVGDEKQSIYGFRGAEVDVFKALKVELAERGGVVHSLPANYRSRPGLIAFFNRVFENVLTEPRFPFEAGFEAMTPAGTGYADRAEVIVFYKNMLEATSDDDDGEAALSADESEAFALASWIRKTVAARSLSVGRGPAARPAAYADFAVLLRSTGNQIIFERTFRRLAVPYETQSVRSLFMEPPVNDLYALLQCALHPDDRTAYATLLRSPFVRLSDRGLLAALAAEPFAAAGLEAEDAGRLARGGEYVRFIRERLGRWPVARLLFHAWYAFGYRYQILRDPTAAMYLEYFEYFYALALRAEQRGQGPEEFLTWTRENLGRYEKLEEIELERPRPGGVRIMTIHKAKGLQFPVVIAANLGNRGRQRAKNPPVHLSSEFGPVVSFGEGSLLVELSAREAEARELAELKRLLYVALTRAQDHLVLSGVLTRWNRSSERSLLTMLFRSLGLDGESNVHEPSGDYDFTCISIPEYGEEAYAERTRRKRTDLSAAAAVLSRAPGPQRDWRRDTFKVTELNDLYVKTLPPGKLEDHVIELPPLPVDRLLKTDEARAQWGSLVHFVINRKFLGRYDRKAVPFSLRTGWDELQFARAAGEAELLADAFLSSDWGKRALAARERETEFSFLFRHGKGADACLIRGAVDLYFVEKGRIQVIDYKTDRWLNPLEYRAQLAVYGAAVTAFTGLPVTSGLYALRTGEMLPCTGEFDLEGFLEYCLRPAESGGE